MKTPQQPYRKLGEALGTEAEIYLKREDLHKYGSHKGRSIPLMIKNYVKNDITDFVISSSGNAALAAIHAVTQHNKNNPDLPITLQVFVGIHIDPVKLKNLQAIVESPSSVVQVERPKQSAFQLDKSGNAKNLRQSTDDLALEGYFELAAELDKIPHLKAIFIPTSSGTTAEAIGKAFELLEQNPQIHIVQTTACHPIVDEVKQSNIQTKSSIAGAIVDKVAYRKQRVAEIVKKTHGFGWIPIDDDISQAIQIIKESTNVLISPNSALSVASLKLALESGMQFKGSVVCLITGQ